MTKAIIESASGHACEDLDLEPLQRELLDLLKGKRYLLVLDDVWDDEQETWQRLRSVLACGGKGASVLVTTRLSKVAAIMGSMPSHDLSVLSDTDCWELFKQRAFGPNEDERADLVIIGKEIVKKCGGVPLAAKTLGGLLRFTREQKEWIYVKENNLWSLQGENSVMSALRLSYLNLPVKLRQCFALCALFPKDEYISKQFLIELWMANGFISSNEMLEAQDIGNAVWNELYCRSFFQDTEIDGCGQILYFKMHDLVHDLAQSITEETCHITNDSGVHSVSDKIRHLSIDGWDLSGEPDSIKLHNVESLKTCINDSGRLSPCVLKCYSLRALDFQRRKKLPSSIGHLKCLRYLNLAWGDFKTLPESLCTLWNLLVLKLDYCEELKELPNSLVHLKFLQHLSRNGCDSLSSLPNSLVHLKFLQHLSLNGCDSLSSLPPYVRMLASLKTLTLYVVGMKIGFLLAELGQMNLQGKLYIKHLERVTSVMNAKEANMSTKKSYRIH